MPEKIEVPDIVHPTLCWKQEVRNNVITTFVRCIYPKNHEGPHSWQLPNRRDVNQYRKNVH